MFKSMIIYRYAESWQSDLQALEDALQNGEGRAGLSDLPASLAASASN